MILTYKQSKDGEVCGNEEEREGWNLHYLEGEREGDKY